MKLQYDVKIHHYPDDKKKKNEMEIGNYRLCIVWGTKI